MQRYVLNVSAVENDRLIGSVRFYEVVLTDKTADFQAVFNGFDFQTVAYGFVSVNSDYRLVERAARSVQFFFSVEYQPE